MNRRDSAGIKATSLTIKGNLHQAFCAASVTFVRRRLIPIQAVARPVNPALASDPKRKPGTIMITKLAKLFEPEIGTENVSSGLHAIFDFVLVQAAGFRCIAYCDQNGTWREAFNHREIPGQVQVLG